MVCVITCKMTVSVSRTHADENTEAIVQSILYGYIVYDIGI